MSIFTINRTVLMIIVVIAIAVAVVVFVKGLIFPDLPLPETEKTRFLRYLSCAYAMCAKGCGEETIGIWLDAEKGGCKDVCDGMMGDPDCEKVDGHPCGEGCYLEFNFSESVTYFANYPVWLQSGIGYAPWKMDTDTLRIKHWDKTILEHNYNGDYCFGGTYPFPDDRVTLDGREFARNCHHAITGLCEGVLMRSGACDWGDRGAESNEYNTGHIWIGPAIESQCDPFENPMYLGNCSFNEDQTIYIWAKVDTITPAFMRTFYCPELIICKNP